MRKTSLYRKGRNRGPHRRVSPHIRRISPSNGMPTPKEEQHMSLSSYGSSRADRWLVPRQPLDPCARLLTYGPIQPMEPSAPASVWSRWFSRA